MELKAWECHRILEWFGLEGILKVELEEPGSATESWNCLGWKWF